MHSHVGKIAPLALLALAGLTACHPSDTLKDSRDAHLFVSYGGQGRGSGYIPTGYGWTPGSKVEISIWLEPDGPGSASTQWKKLFEEHVGPYGMFGFGSGAPYHPVSRTICGSPSRGQTVTFMARSLTTGTIEMRQVPADPYFTFKPCAN